MPERVPHSTPSRRNKMQNIRRRINTRPLQLVFANVCMHIIYNMFLQFNSLNILTLFTLADKFSVI